MEQRGKQRKWPAILLLGALAFLIVALAIPSEDGDGDGDSNEADTPAAPESRDTEARESQPEPDAEAENDAAARQLRVYLRENFGGSFGPGSKTSWYDNIGAVSVIADSATVETDLFNDADVTRPAGDICGAVVGSRADTGITRARVLDGRGEELDVCESGVVE